VSKLSLRLKPKLKPKTKLKTKRKPKPFSYFLDCYNMKIFNLAEPRCPQGQAYKDHSGSFVACSTNRAKSTCPANYECTFDGNMFGCCPTKGILFFYKKIPN
jgi:hypothetical protein